MSDPTQFDPVTEAFAESLDGVTPIDSAQVQAFLDNRSRKVLHYRTPLEVINRPRVLHVRFESAVIGHSNFLL